MTGVVVLGVITGLTYGVVAVGLVLAYRASGVINFALGNVGGLAAAVMGRLSLSLGLPWLLVFPVALASGAGAAALVEMTIMRRLRRAPGIMAIVATLGAAQLLLGIAGSITHIRSTALFPAPFDLHFEIGDLVVTPYYTLILVLSPILIAALAWFLAPPSWMPQWLRSRYGPALRAAADNPDAARTVGISTDAMATLAWALSGALASFAAVLLAPARGFNTIDALGPDLLVRALAPAVLAGMANLPVALVVAVVIGVFERLMLFNGAPTGWVDAALFVLILLGLLARRRSDEVAADASWLSLPVSRPVPDVVRKASRVAVLVGVVIAFALPVVLSNAQASVFITIFALATIGLSVTVITGVAGQISLGQFALAGVGALVTTVLFMRLDIPWGPSLVLGAVAGAAGSLVVGLPALRLRGLLLAVTSLAFAVMAPSFIFGSDWGLGTGADPGLPIIGSSEVDTERGYYYIALIVFVVCAALVHNVKRFGLGRILEAIRDNEDAARAFGISATVRKLQSFAVAGLIAGVGGVVYGQSLGRLTVDTFGADRSVALLSMVVLGGIGRVSGALLGAAYLVGLPTLIHGDTIQLMVSGVGVLIFVLYVPGGLAQLLDQLRFVLSRRFAADAAPATVTVQDALPEASPVAASDGPPILRAADVVVEYGHVRALDGMSLTVREGEVLGIIGPNGSGKTTLFKVVSGFLRPRDGRIELGGRDVSRLAPEHRARLGLIRSFQDSLLFPTLTVVDAVKLSLEHRTKTRVTSSVVGLPNARRSERRRTEAAMDLVELLGLAPYRDTLVGELSTGTRRITELCCLLALSPKVLLLDEPSSGIAQSETEALRDLVVAIRARLNTTLVVIEHDMPLISSISDRIVAMASGRVIAEGTPSEVQSDDRVIASYLGTDAVAIGRSGAAPD